MSLRHRNTPKGNPGENHFTLIPFVELKPREQFASIMNLELIEKGALERLGCQKYNLHQFRLKKYIRKEHWSSLGVKRTILRCNIRYSWNIRIIIENIIVSNHLSQVIVVAGARLHLEMYATWPRMCRNM